MIRRSVAGHLVSRSQLAKAAEPENETTDGIGLAEVGADG